MYKALKTTRKVYKQQLKKRAKQETREQRDRIEYEYKIIILINPITGLDRA
jgi:hypothetical protein